MFSFIFIKKKKKIPSNFSNVSLKDEVTIIIYTKFQFIGIVSRNKSRAEKLKAMVELVWAG